MFLAFGVFGDVVLETRWCVGLSLLPQTNNNTAVHATVLSSMSACR